MSEGFQIAMKNGQGTKAKKKIEKLLRELLLDIGENPYREGLVDTPARMAEIYTMNSELDVTFTEAGETIIAKDIEFYSMCEHHMLPFFGNIDIAYLPGGKVVGISKLVRVVEKYARRMQIQERLIKEIADKITRRGVKGALVVAEAKHMCMKMRGVRNGSSILTVAHGGEFHTFRIISITQPS